MDTSFCNILELTSAEHKKLGITIPLFAANSIWYIQIISLGKCILSCMMEVVWAYIGFELNISCLLVLITLGKKTWTVNTGQTINTVEMACM